MQTRQNFRSRPFAILLVIFLGWMGAHHFYLGRIGWGFVYLFLFWTGLPLFGSFFDLIDLLTTPDPAFDAKFNAIA